MERYTEKHAIDRYMKGKCVTTSCRVRFDNTKYILMKCIIYLQKMHFHRGEITKLLYREIYRNACKGPLYKRKINVLQPSGEYDLMIKEYIKEMEYLRSSYLHLPRAST